MFMPLLCYPLRGKREKAVGRWWDRSSNTATVSYMMKMECESRGSEGGTQLAEFSASACGTANQTCYDPLPLRQAEDTLKTYPRPLATYEEVVADPKYFMETLEKLHSSMRTKFMIPIIGGKELDLHRLFVEVTSRGGLERVIKERRWKDITAVFNFPSTATNASFVLRKYYGSLLHHYEQIYFFKSEEFVPPPAATLPIQSHNASIKRSLESGQGQTPPQRRRSAIGGLPELSPSSMNYPVVGIIDGKFEHGYFVTVTAGSEKLKGVLYHTAECGGPQFTNSDLAAAGTTASGRRRRRRRKKTEMRKKDPSHPKPNRSGYNFFFAEQHARLKPEYPGKDREISKMIGELWNKLSDEEKAVYQERGVKDKERYRNEMEEYRERLKLSTVITDAQPIDQHPAVDDPAEITTCRENVAGKVVVNSNKFGEPVPISGINTSDGKEPTTLDKDSEKKCLDVADEETFEFRQRSTACAMLGNFSQESDVSGSSSGGGSTAEEEELEEEET